MTHRLEPALEVREVLKLLALAFVRDDPRWFDTVATARRAGAAISKIYRIAFLHPVTSCGGNDRKQQPSILSRLL
jgi:hypothetical protein